MDEDLEDLVFLQPTIIQRHLQWELRALPRISCITDVAAWKVALGLRPRAAADHARAARLAVKNWALLEIIGREAVRTGAVTESSASKSWNRTYHISEEVFLTLLRRSQDHLAR